jgi:hypothetical protein
MKENECMTVHSGAGILPAARITSGYGQDARATF